MCLQGYLRRGLRNEGCPDEPAPRLATINVAMIQYLYLGRVDYAEGLRLQDEFSALVAEGRLHNVLLLLEHPPVLTLGRNANRANVLASRRTARPRAASPSTRSTAAATSPTTAPASWSATPSSTCGPCTIPTAAGMGPVDFVRGMEEALIRLCAGFGVRAGRIAGLTGVWCGLRAADLWSRAVPPGPEAQDRRHRDSCGQAASPRMDSPST